MPQAQALKAIRAREDVLERLKACAPKLDGHMLASGCPVLPPSEPLVRLFFRSACRCSSCSATLSGVRGAWHTLWCPLTLHACVRQNAHATLRVPNMQLHFFLPIRRTTWPARSMYAVCFMRQTHTPTGHRPAWRHNRSAFMQPCTCLQRRYRLRGCAVHLQQGCMPVYPGARETNSCGTAHVLAHV